MIDLAPLAGLPPAVALHLAAAVAALLIGPVALYRSRRDAVHRALGYVWFLAMATAALSSFFIPAVVLPLAWGFGAIHALSVWALFNLWQAVRDARAARIAAHRARMRGLYWQALGIAGLLTLLPGRVLNEVLLPGHPLAGVWLAAGGAAAILAGPHLGRIARRRPARG